MVAQSEKLQKTFDNEISKALHADEGERSVVARISTIAVDRDGDILLPSGMDASDFQKNPVVMFQHGLDAKQGATPIGSASELKQGRNHITAKMKFAHRPDSLPPTAEWMADTIFSLFQQKIFRAFSIGFIPTEIRAADEKDRDKFGESLRQIIVKWKLLEFSVVAVPANQEALVTSVSKGIDIGTNIPQLWNLQPRKLEIGIPKKSILSIEVPAKRVLELR